MTGTGGLFGFGLPSYKAFTAAAAPVLAAAEAALSRLDSWTADAVEGALRTALIDELGLKPRAAFTPVRVAVTGRRVSPPLFESIELLGRDRTLARIARAQAAVPSDPSA